MRFARVPEIFQKYVVINNIALVNVCITQRVFDNRQTSNFDLLYL
jgi:hypothetical protein